MTESVWYKNSSLIAVFVIVCAIPLYLITRNYTIDKPRKNIETIAAYPEPDYAKVMSLGYNAMAADFLFTKAQYYYGSHYVTDRTYHLLEQMIRVIMALNPSLKFLIFFGDAALTSMNDPKALESANRLLDLGHEIYPDDYEFVFRKGFNHYFYSGDMEQAYTWMYKGATMKGAPEKLYWLVSKIAAKGGGYQLGLEYTQDMLAKAKDKNMKNYLNLRLKLFSDLIALSDVSSKYFETTGKYPDAELKDFVKAGYIDAIPKEPFGGKYIWNDKKFRVETSSKDLYLKK